MSVIGYEEALATAVEIEIEPEFVVPVISLPGLALLKLLAWMDRSNETTKDAIDLATLLSTYDQAGNEDRLWGDEIKMLETAGFNPTNASPELLGKDVRNMARPETLERALGFLRDGKRADQLATHMAPSLRHHEDPIAAQRLLECFKAGLVGH